MNSATSSKRTTVEVHVVYIAIYKLSHPMATILYIYEGLKKALIKPNCCKMEDVAMSKDLVF